MLYPFLTRGFIALLLPLAAGTAVAADPAADPAVTNATAAANAKLLEKARAAAIDCTADFIIHHCRTNVLGLAAEPVERRRVVEYKTTKEVRYRKVTVEEPVYEMKEISSAAVGGKGSAAGARKVGKTTRKISTGKKIGTRTVEREVPDPKGDIVKKVPTDPVYEDAADLWYPQYLGVNAMALAALRHAGHSEKHPQVAKLLETLMSQLRFMPDTTFDLAWVVAALCLTDGSSLVPSEQERFARIRAAAVNKLLDGQIRQGEAEGLWGPVCVNHEMLAQLIHIEQARGEELAALQAELRRKENATRRRKAKELEADVNRARQAAKQAAPMLSTFPRSGYVATDAVPGHSSMGALVVSPLFDPYRHELGDIQCTSWVLFALEQAARAKVLPAATRRPEMRNAELPEADKTLELLTRCAARIALLQQKDGGWDAGNLHQPNPHYAKLNLVDKPAKQLELESPRHLGTDAAGWACLQRLRSLLGRNFPPPARKAMARAKPFLEAKIAAEDFDPAAADTWCAPYDLLFDLSAGRDPLYRPDALQWLFDQQEDGSWFSKPEQALIKAPAAARIRNSTSIAALFKAFPKHMQDTGWRSSAMGGQTWQYHLPRNLLPSMYGLLSLGPAGAGPGGGPTGLAVGFLPNNGDMPRALKMAQVAGMNRKFSITADAVDGQIGARFPMVFLHGLSALADPDARGRLVAYIKSGGTLFVEVDDAKSWKAAQQALPALVDQGYMRRLPAGAPLLRSLKGARLPVSTLKIRNGPVRAYLVGAMSPAQHSQAAHTGYLLIRNAAVKRSVEKARAAAERMATDEGFAALRATHQRNRADILGSLSADAP